MQCEGEQSTVGSGREAGCSMQGWQVTMVIGSYFRCVGKSMKWLKQGNNGIGFHFLLRQGPVGSWLGGIVVMTARASGCLIKEASQLGMPSRQLIVPF